MILRHHGMVLEDAEGKELTSAECLFVKARVNPRARI